MRYFAIAVVSLVHFWAGGISFALHVDGYRAWSVAVCVVSYTIVMALAVALEDRGTR